MSGKNSSGEEEGEIVAGESAILHDIGKGIVSGLVGAAVVAILIFVQGAAGLLPQVNFIGMLGGLAGGSAVIGWVILFVAGGILGIAFASLDGHVEHMTGADEIVHGALFAVLLWGVLLLVLMPVAASGSEMSLAIALAVGNLAFGLVMGAVYGALNPEDAANG